MDRTTQIWRIVITIVLLLSATVFGRGTFYTGGITIDANGVIKVADGSPGIDFDDVNDWLEIAGNVVVGEDNWVGRDATASWVFNTMSDYVTTLGNVGIGTVTPSAELEVAGSIIIADAGYIGSASDPDAFQIEADGDIVMSQDLAVIGSINLTKLYAVGTNLGLGWYTLDGITSGGYNICVGDYAGEAITEGNRNTLIGYEAGDDLTDGHDNFFLGSASGGDSLHGAYNVGIGESTLYNCEGEYNLGIGTFALYDADDADNNVAFGAWAGTNITSGDDNIFLGYKAGYNQTTNSDLLIIDNQDRASAANELTTSLVYGTFAAAAADQDLRLNADIGINKTPIVELDVVGDVNIASAVDSTTGFQIFDADGGTPIFNVDTTNERIGIGTATPETHVSIQGATSNLNIVEVRNFDPGSTGQRLSLIHDSNSPANSDVVGRFPMLGKNDADALFHFSNNYTVAEDVTDGTEDGKFVIHLGRDGVENVPRAVFDGETRLIGDVRFADAIAGAATYLFGDVGTLSVGIGTVAPATQLHLAKDGDAYLTLQNLTNENGADGAETRVLFQDHAANTLAQIEGSHGGVANNSRGNLIFSTNTGAALTEAGRFDRFQTLTLTGDLVSGGWLKLMEQAADPPEPAEGQCVIWMSDGTGKGDDGDVLIASKAGGTTTWTTLFDHSGGAAW